MKKITQSFSKYILLLFLFGWLNPDVMLSQVNNYHEFIDNMYQYSVPLFKAGSAHDVDHFKILDTRAKREFNVSHLPGAIWVGYEDFSLKRLNDLDYSTPLLVYCSVGYRSERIGEQLQNAGYQHVNNLYGGIFEWVNLGLPLENSRGQATLKIHAYNRDWGKWLEKGIKVYR